MTTNTSNPGRKMARCCVSKQVVEAKMASIGQLPNDALSFIYNKQQLTGTNYNLFRL